MAQVLRQKLTETNDKNSALLTGDESELAQNHCRLFGE